MKSFDEIFKDFNTARPNPKQRVRVPAFNISDEQEHHEHCFEPDLPENAIHFCITDETFEASELAKHMVMGEILNTPRWRKRY